MNSSRLGVITQKRLVIQGCDILDLCTCSDTLTQSLRSLSPVPSFAKEAVASLAESAGQDYETVVYLLGVFLCYPLGLIMLALPYGKLKHLFSFILGAFLLQFTIGVQWIHHLISSLVAYAMFMFLPAKVAKIAVPVWMMVYMTAGMYAGESVPLRMLKTNVHAPP